ncbi:major facilitator superfamily domain-containing protein [Coniochaeta sp. 2T2.1]|nr:major facilitator superfamily domain-containing protein [Coniochaeta sp. 2T2.1]
MAVNDEKAVVSDGDSADRQGMETNDRTPSPNPETQTPPPTDDVEASSERRSLEPIPRSQRRGLFGRFTLIPEVANPSHYPKATKWLMTVTVALAGATSSTGSSIFYPALAEVANDLHTTQTVTNLSLAFYLLAMAFTPLWWSSFSETLGRRTIYIISFSLFTLFSILSAVSVNIAMLIVFRILSGGAAASVQAVGAGTVSDLWPPKERGKAMGIFYLGPLCGLGIAPIIGGALTAGLGWQSTLWFLVIFGAVLFFLILFCLPETLPRPPTPAQPTPRMTPRRIAHRLLTPLSVLSYLRHPAVLVSVYSAATAFGSLYVANISIQSALSRPPYLFTPTEIGLVYLAPTLGYALASVLGGRWTDHIMAREARRANRFSPTHPTHLILLPEDRLKENIWLAATLYPASMIWYGWSVDRQLHWAIACAANLFFGVGGMLVFGAATTALTEFLPGRAAGGVALNNFVRSIFATVGVVVTQPLIDAVGDGWTCTIVGLAAWVTGNVAVGCLVRWGGRWRGEMDRKLRRQER